MKKILIFLSILISICFVNVLISMAACTSSSDCGGNACIEGECSTTNTKLNKSTTDTVGNFPNPLKGIDTPQQLIGKVINAILGIVGSLALVMFIYGGLTWMLAAGNSQSVDKGKSILIWATIGLVVIFSSYALVNFVIFTALK